MSCTQLQNGRDTIKLLKDLFHIDCVAVRKITLTAEVNEATTIKVETFVKLKDVDITSTEISRDTVEDCHTYEVSIKRIDKD